MTEKREQIQMILKKQQYGPNLKLIISLFKKPYIRDKIIYNVETKPFNVENLAEGFLEFEDCCDMIKPTLSMRKHVKAKNSIVRIDISMNTCRGIYYCEQYFCSENWVDINMDQFHFIQKLTVSDHTIMAYIVEFNICVHEIMPRAMKLYEDEEFTDFQLHAVDGNVAVHRAMLSVHSEVFKVMLKGDFKEKAECHIKLDGITVQTLQHLKDYLYLGALPDDGLEKLIAFASCYMIEQLKIDCAAKLIKSIKAENFDSLVKLACQHNFPELVTALVFQTPDEVLNGIHQLKIEEQEGSKDKDDK